MFEFLKGTLIEKSINTVVVDTGGVGYLLEISLQTFENLPQPGEQCVIFSHFHVREDIQKLYGFAEKTEREMFRLLISINKIGPRVALSILSQISSAELLQAVASEDASKLKSIPGVGPKTASRLVLELKGKVDTNMVAAPVKAAGPGAVPGSEVHPRFEAREALLALGYNDKAVTRAVDRVAKEIAPEAPVEEWIKMSLQVI